MVEVSGGQMVPLDPSDWALGIIPAPRPFPQATSITIPVAGLLPGWNESLNPHDVSFNVSGMSPTRQSKHHIHCSNHLYLWLYPPFGSQKVGLRDGGSHFLKERSTSRITWWFLLAFRLGVVGCA